MPEDINMKIILYVTNRIRNLFYFRIFSKNGVERGYKYKNTKKVHIQTSMTPQCASYREV